MRYISEEDLLEALEAIGHDRISIGLVKATIKRAPTADVVPLVHGKIVQVDVNNGHRKIWFTGCSVCRAPIPTDTQLDVVDEGDLMYCYWCGAKMDL